jgi:[acyl-carrier-protein] S-malonyltransferase
MRKAGILFPGVGSQKSGTGKDFYDAFPLVREVFEEAGSHVQMDMAALCFDSANQRQLKSIDGAQYSLLTLSYAFYKVLELEGGVAPAALAGYSFGEYIALCASGVLTFADAFTLVRERQRIISRQVAEQSGDMLWAMEVDSEIVHSICEGLTRSGSKVYVSAYNSSGHFTLSGTEQGLQEAISILEQESGLLYPLKLGGPYHCPLMAQAQEDFQAVIESFRFNEPSVPVVSNVTGLPYCNSAEIRASLAKHLTSPIQWTGTIEWMMAQNMDTILEVGPNAVLSFLMKGQPREIHRTFHTLEDLHIR